MKLTVPALILLAALPHAVAARDIPETARPAPILATELGGGDITFLTGASQALARLVSLCDIGRTHATLPEVRALAEAIGKEQADELTAIGKLAAAEHSPLGDILPVKEAFQEIRRAKGPRIDKLFLDALRDALDQLDQSLEPGAASHDQAIAARATAAQQGAAAARAQLRKMGM